MIFKYSQKGSALLTLLSIIIATLFPAYAQTPQPVAKAAGSAKIALLIGISNYPDGTDLNKIDGCVNNVPLLADALRDYGFEDGNVLRLTEKAATHQAIIDNFRSQLIGKAKAIKANNGEAVVVFYFCGHGSQYPDQDGDEADGLDETLVAYDSRSTAAFDILDDEIDDLKAELRQYTSNTTIILESCHSGTGSRGGDGYVSEQADDDQRKRAPYKRKYPPSSDADTLTYAEIDASMSNRTAKSESAAGCNCDKPYSLMTKALVQALKRATPATTYRGLVSEVADEVSRVSQQEPQAEGSRDSLLFGGAAARVRSYFPVSEVRSDGTVIIDAGAVHGLKVGSQVAFYSSSSKTNAGRDGWIANGVATTIGTGNSVISIPKPAVSDNAPTVDKRSRAILASPVFGGGSVLVSLLPAAPGADGSPDTALRADVEKLLRDDHLIDDQIITLANNSPVSATDRSSARIVIRLRRGKVGDIFRDDSQIMPLRSANYCDGPTLKTRTSAERLPAKDAEVYYLDNGTGSAAPLFGYTFDPASKAAAADIAAAIRTIALQQNLRGLNNAASTLGSNIDVSFETGPADAITAVCSDDGKLGRKADPEKFKAFARTKNYSVPFGSLARLTLKNMSGDIRKKTDPYASGEPLFVTVLGITTKGEVQVFDNGSGARDPLSDGKQMVIYLSGEPPTGVEHYIVVVSREYADFSFYRTWSVVQRDTKLSPLQLLLRQPGLAARDAKTIIDQPDSWGVIRLDVNVAGLDRPKR